MQQNSTTNFAFVTIDSLNAILDVKVNEWFNKFLPLPAGDASLLSTDSSKIVSMAGQMMHHGFLMGNPVLELHELRRQNAELTSKIIKSRSLEANCEICNNNNNNSYINSELSSNPTLPPLNRSITPNSICSYSFSKTCTSGGY